MGKPATTEQAVHTKHQVYGEKAPAKNNLQIFQNTLAHFLGLCLHLAKRTVLCVVHAAMGRERGQEDTVSVEARSSCSYRLETETDIDVDSIYIYDCIDTVEQMCDNSCTLHVHAQ